MLNALEIFHYSSRFQNHLFILNLESMVDIGKIITDLRVLNRAQIKIIVVLPNYDKLPDMLTRWNLQGCPLVYFRVDTETDFDHNNTDLIKEELAAGNIPVLGIIQESDADESLNQTDGFTMDLSSVLPTDKVFFLSNHSGLFIDDQFVSHTTPQGVTQFLEQNCTINIGSNRLALFIDHNKKYGFDIVLLEGSSGCLFEEIFSHRGRGTLITSDYPNIIRQGQTSDIMDIALLMKPYIDTGMILPVTEEDLSNDINNYYVYSVNNSIVAASMLKDHGIAAELAKFSTLPRYQGKGRAKELAEMMIEKANLAKKQFIFALTVEPKMFEFFSSLGFEECDRDLLPEIWKSKYDMTRPSIAFIKHLNFEPI